MCARPVPDFGAEDFAAQIPVSRETLARLETYVRLLQDWSARHNLVSAKSLEDVWRRHVWDSAQLAPLVPADATTLADLGSGAGFPGLVLAELRRGRLAVTLFEATRKKAEFLRAAADRMELEIDIRNERIESATAAKFDVITARALAPLNKLLAYAQPLRHKKSLCLFLKGQNLDAELTEARRHWKMDIVRHPSATDPAGVVLEVREFRHV